MPQIAGFRGALWNASKVDIAKVVTAPVKGAKDLLASGELVRDPTRAMYRYFQTFEHGGRSISRAMLACAVRLAPWSDGSIRAHEATDAEARDAAIQGITDAGAHTEPVFAGYRDAAREVERLLRGVEDGRPVIEVKTADGTLHRLWRVPSAEVIGKLGKLFAPKKLHVLDGHARYEGMLAYAQQLGADGQPQYSSANYGLACLVNIDDPTIIVAARHRVVRGESLDRDAVLTAAKQYFIVDKLTGGAKDLARQESALADVVAHQPAFVALFAGDADAYKLTLKPDVSPVYEGISVHRALQKYAPIVIEQLFLARCTPGATSTTEREPAAVQAAVAGGAQLGLVINTLTLEQVIHVDELNALLPFGSTAFAPPLANLVTFFIDPDEDLV
jgi:uncharacterized protein (DUF1015 family)